MIGQDFYDVAIEIFLHSYPPSLSNAKTMHEQLMELQRQGSVVQRTQVREGLEAWQVPALFVACCGVLVFQGCKQESENDRSVSYYLKDSEDCTRASAAAILKAGLPYPNYGTVEVPDHPASGVIAKRRIKTVDMWLGDVRFVIPAEVAATNPGYAEHHPRRFQRLGGALPNFYPRGPAAPVIDGMGPMVDVQFKCSMDPKYAASWGKGYRSNEEGIAAVKAQYEKELQIAPQYSGIVSVNRREDIGMIEVLLDRQHEANGQHWWEATYWPIDGELRGPDGAVSSIKCQIRHDPEQRRYGHRGWPCTAGMRLTPNAATYIDIYVSHIQQMPAVFEQVKRLLINAKQPARD